MQNDYTKIIPIRFQDASYEDLPERYKEILTKQIKSRNGIYFWGGAGVGKTHIVCAITKQLLKNGIEVMYFNTSEFLEKLRDEFEEDLGDMGLFKRVMDFKGVLIFDDIGAEKTSDWTLERLYMVINRKYEDMIPIIFTSNYDMEILSARVGDRISSRIAGMTYIINVDGDDKRKPQ